MSETWEYCYIASGQQLAVFFCKPDGQTLKQTLQPGMGQDENSAVAILGAHGWEMVGVAAGEGFRTIYFKRLTRPGRDTDDVAKLL